MPKEDSCSLWRLSQDVADLLDLLVLVGLYLLWAEYGEIDLVGVLWGLDILILRLEPYVVLLHVKIGVYRREVRRCLPLQRNQGILTIIATSEAGIAITIAHEVLLAARAIELV